MIKIRKSPTADTRTCDWSRVTKKELLEASEMHISDVRKGMYHIGNCIDMSAVYHDHDKISGIDHFHSDFVTGFEEQGWYENHLRVSRHHIDRPEGVRDDVNLVDVIEHVVDCVMAGMARSGEVRPVELPDELLQKAVKNTVEMLKEQIEVEAEDNNELDGEAKRCVCGRMDEIEYQCNVCGDGLCTDSQCSRHCHNECVFLCLDCAETENGLCPECGEPLE